MGQASQRLLTATEKVSGVGYGWFKLAYSFKTYKINLVVLPVVYRPGSPITQVRTY
jgi:hypothetical protein